MRDIDDRVAEVQIDPVHEHLLEVLDTSPPRGPRSRAGGVRRRLAVVAAATLAWCWRRGRRPTRSTAAPTCSATSRRSRCSAASRSNRYPLSAYSLDYHTDVGITDLDGVPATIAHWAAAQLWSLTSFLVKTVIDLFTWAFSLDLLGGDPNRADDGALAPVSAAVSSLYENVIGEAWMVAAIILAGIWGIWKALVQRRYTETAGALGVSVLFVLIALFFVYQPERTIGQASQWTNTLSLAFLSGANRGTIDDPGQANARSPTSCSPPRSTSPGWRSSSAGLRHCVDSGRPRRRRVPAPGQPARPGRRRLPRPPAGRPRRHGGYAPRFLRYLPGRRSATPSTRRSRTDKPRRTTASSPAT